VEPPDRKEPSTKTKYRNKISFTTKRTWDVQKKQKEKKIKDQKNQKEKR